MSERGRLFVTETCCQIGKIGYQSSFFSISFLHTKMLRFYAEGSDVKPCFSLGRLGRKVTVQGFYALAGIGCLASGICRIFEDISVLGTLSAVFAMLGMIGGSGAFDTIFFYTTELFPTNFRNQAMGTGSAVGRVGGMIAPFMKNLLLVVVWGPGVITGLLCTFVVIGLHFLPETRGKALPTEIEDVEAWYSSSKKKNKLNGNGNSDCVSL